jgi:RDD family.
MSTKRLFAFVIDYLILLIIVIPIVFLINFDSFFDSTEENFNRSFETAYSIICIALFVFCNKDLVNGRSIGKRIAGIGVKDHSDARIVPGKMRLFLRNITLILWPIELLLLLTAGKRLGDRLARTNVVEVSKKHSL